MTDILQGVGGGAAFHLYTVGDGSFPTQNRYLVIGGGPGLHAVSGRSIGRDDTIGTPSSFKIVGATELGPFDWPVVAGTWTIDGKVLYTPDDGSGRRPRLIVKAASQLGVQTDRIALAPSGANVLHDFPTLTLVIVGTGILRVMFDYPNNRADGVGTAGSPRVFANLANLAVAKS